MKYVKADSEKEDAGIHLYEFLLSASSLWVKLLIGKLGVFEADTLEAWYEYFSTGAMDKFFALMQTLPSGE